MGIYHQMDVARFKIAWDFIIHFWTYEVMAALNIVKRKLHS